MAGLLAIEVEKAVPFLEGKTVCRRSLDMTWRGCGMVEVGTSIPSTSDRYREELKAHQAIVLLGLSRQSSGKKVRSNPDPGFGMQSECRSAIGVFRRRRDPRGVLSSFSLPPLPKMMPSVSHSAHHLMSWEQ
jgi:hypothetical protein